MLKRIDNYLIPKGYFSNGLTVKEFTSLILGTYNRRASFRRATVFNGFIEKEGFYGAVSWEVFDWIALGTSNSEFYPDKNDKDGKNIEAGGLPDYFAWQKDITLSVRSNITEYWCVKLEAHIIDGLGLADIEVNLQDDSEQNWFLYAVKTSLSF